MSVNRWRACHWFSSTTGNGEEIDTFFVSEQVSLYFSSDVFRREVLAGPSESIQQPRRPRWEPLAVRHHRARRDQSGQSDESPLTRYVRCTPSGQWSVRRSTLLPDIADRFLSLECERSLLHFAVTSWCEKKIWCGIWTTWRVFSKLSIRMRPGSFLFLSRDGWDWKRSFRFRRLMEEDDDGALSEIEPDSVPNEVRDWLAMTFTRSMSTIKRRESNKPKFKSVAQAIRAGIMVDRYVVHLPHISRALLSSRYLRRLSIDIKFKVSDFISFLSETHASFV